MSTLQKVRIDKWLWAVRAFKTRSLATEACTAGKIKVNGTSVKPARNIAIGESVHFTQGIDKKIWKVLQLIEKRVSAPLAQACYEDLSPAPTPPAEPSVFIESVFRTRGEGRPTKKERRDIDKYRPE